MGLVLFLSFEDFLLVSISSCFEKVKRRNVNVCVVMTENKITICLVSVIKFAKIVIRRHELYTNLRKSGRM